LVGGGSIIRRKIVKSIMNDELLILNFELTSHLVSFAKVNSSDGIAMELRVQN